MSIKGFDRQSKRMRKPRPNATKIFLLCWKMRFLVGLKRSLGFQKLTRMLYFQQRVNNAVSIFTPEGLGALAKHRARANLHKASFAGADFFSGTFIFPRFRDPPFFNRKNPFFTGFSVSRFLTTELIISISFREKLKRFFFRRQLVTPELKTPPKSLKNLTTAHDP